MKGLIIIPKSMTFECVLKLPGLKEWECFSVCLFFLPTECPKLAKIFFLNEFYLTRIQVLFQNYSN